MNFHVFTEGLEDNNSLKHSSVSVRINVHVHVCVCTFISSLSSCSMSFERGSVTMSFILDSAPLSHASKGKVSSA